MVQAPPGGAVRTIRSVMLSPRPTMTRRPSRTSRQIGSADQENRPNTAPRIAPSTATTSQPSTTTAAMHAAATTASRNRL